MHGRGAVAEGIGDQAHDGILREADELRGGEQCKYGEQGTEDRRSEPSRVGRGFRRVPADGAAVPEVRPGSDHRAG